MKSRAPLYAGLLLILVSSANGAIITSSTDPALSGATVEGFDSYALGNIVSLVTDDFTLTEFESAGASLKIENRNGTFGITGLALTSYTGHGFKVDFASPVSAFGIHIGAADTGKTWTIEAFNPAGTSLGSDSVLITSAQNSNGFFIGWSDASIGSVDLTPSAFPDVVILDNLSFVAVPEPATSALFIGLAAGALLCLRRLRRDPVV